MSTAVVKDHASQKRRNATSKFFIYFFLIVITACMLLPFLWMLSSSFKLNKDVFGFPDPVESPKIPAGRTMWTSGRRSLC